MGYGGADIVNELLFNQLLAVPDAVEHFPHRNWRDGVLADQAETLLVFSGSRIFHPEQTVLFNAFAESRRFDGRQTVVHVVKEMFIEAELTPIERSEEHTSELQSRENLVCRLLLEKKKIAYRFSISDCPTQLMSAMTITS